MAILSQFLAALANDIKKAKTLVDVDTARQSTRFLKDDFLRLLPITRVDLDNVLVRFKMAVKEVMVTPKDSPFFSALIEKLEPIVTKVAKTKKIEIAKETFSSATTEAAMLTLVPELTEMDPSRINLIQSTLTNRFTQNFSERFVKMAPDSTATERKQVLKDAQEAFTSIFNSYVETYKEDLAAQLLKELGRLDVVVEGDHLKEFPPDALVELELRLVPKTYHWALKPEYVDKPEAPAEEKFTLMPG
jgi:hypothetical protein